MLGTVTVLLESRPSAAEMIVGLFVIWFQLNGLLKMSNRSLNFSLTCQRKADHRCAPVSRQT